MVLDHPVRILQPEFLRKARLKPKPALLEGCAVCDKKEDLKICTSCKVILYCSREHQSQHRKSHKEFCNFVKETRGTLESIDALLGPLPEHRMFPNFPNLPRIISGQFDEETEQYIKGIYNLQSCMELAYTRHAIQYAVYLTKLPILYSDDNYLTAGLVSAVWIRLDEDEKVYGWIKSWYLWEEDEEPHPPWKIAPLPIENADILEDVDFYLSIESRFMDFTDTITFLLILTLLKIKILLDLKDLQNARETVGPQVPQEILEKILENIPRSSVIRANRRIMSSPDLSGEIARLDGQVDALYHKINRTNRWWWRVLVDRPEEAINTVLLRARDGSPAESGSPLEAALWLNERNQRFCWAEVPGALDFLREKNAKVPYLRLSETRRVYGRRADELVVALYNTAVLHEHETGPRRL